MASEADPEARLVAMVSMVPFPLPVTVTLTSVLPSGGASEHAHKASVPVDA